MAKEYYTCKCGSDTFVRMYNVWNERIKIKISGGNDLELYDIEELGKEKDHLYGYICAECRQDADELNDGLYSIARKDNRSIIISIFRNTSLVNDQLLEHFQTIGEIREEKLNRILDEKDKQ